MDKLAKFLIKENVVDSTNKRKLNSLLKKCVNETKEKNEDPSCYRTFDYFICINKDHELIDHNKFILAIAALDKTFDI